MVGLVDIAPLSDQATVRGQQLTVRGIGIAGICELLYRFPELRRMLSQQTVDAQKLSELGGACVAAIIARACGAGTEEEEAAVDNLTLDEQADILAKTFRLTLPNGLSPLLERLNALGVAAPSRGKGQATSSRKRSAG